MAEKKKTTKKTAVKTVKKAEAKKPVSHAKPKIETVAPIGTILRWKAPDYYTFERSPYWSLVVGLISTVLALILIYTGNYFPVIIIILAVIVTFQVAHDKPKTQEFSIDEGGVISRNEYIPFTELKSFWVATHGTKSLLYLEPINRFKNSTVIPLGGQNQTELRVFLLRYLPEKMEYGEQFSEKLIRIFKL